MGSGVSRSSSTDLSRYVAGHQAGNDTDDNMSVDSAAAAAAVTRKPVVRRKSALPQRTLVASASAKLTRVETVSTGGSKAKQAPTAATAEPTRSASIGRARGARAAATAVSGSASPAAVATAAPTAAAAAATEDSADGGVSGHVATDAGKERVNSYWSAATARDTTTTPARKTVAERWRLQLIRQRRSSQVRAILEQPPEQQLTETKSTPELLHRRQSSGDSTGGDYYIPPARPLASSSSAPLPSEAIKRRKRGITGLHASRSSQLSVSFRSPTGLEQVESLHPHSSGSGSGSSNSSRGVASDIDDGSDGSDGGGDSNDNDDDRVVPGSVDHDAVGSEPRAEQRRGGSRHSKSSSIGSASEVGVTNLSRQSSNLSSLTCSSGRLSRYSSDLSSIGVVQEYATRRTDMLSRTSSTRSMLTIAAMADGGSSAGSREGQAGPVPESGEEADAGAVSTADTLSTATRVTTMDPVEVAGRAKYATMKERLRKHASARSANSHGTELRRVPSLGSVNLASTGCTSHVLTSMPRWVRTGRHTQASTSDDGMDEMLAGLLDHNVSPSQLGRVVAALPSKQRVSAVREMAEQMQVMQAQQMLAMAVAQESVEETMLQAVVDLAVQATGAERGALFHVDVKAGLLVTRAATAVKRIEIPLTSGIAGWAARHNRAINVADASQDSRFNRHVDAASGFTTTGVMAVPVQDPAGDVLAVLEVVNKVGGVFGRRDEQMLDNVGFMASSVVQKLLLTEQMLRARHRNRILLSVARSFSTVLQLPHLLRTIMDHAAELMEADNCVFYLVDRQRGYLWCLDEDGEEEHFPLNTAVGVPGFVATTGQVLLLEDPYRDPRFDQMRDVASGTRTRNLLAVPVRNMSNSSEVVGVAEVSNKTDGTIFNEDDTELLEAFAAQAAVAIESSQLISRELRMRNYLDNVLQSISNLVMTLDAQGRLRHSNKPAGEVLGLDESLMREQHYHEWLGMENQSLLRDVDEVYASAVPRYVEDARYIVLAPSTPGGSARRRVLSVNYSIVPLMGREILGIHAHRSSCQSPDMEARHGDGDELDRGVVIVFEDVTPQKRLRTTLQRYMSPMIANQIIAEGGSKLGGNRQKASILFADIRGYTSLTEGMAPEDVVRLLNAYFSEMVEAIFQWNGVLDKFIGDAVMAVFGVPIENTQDPEKDSLHACMAALGMKRRLGEFNARRRAKQAAELRIGIGISTGRVLCGNIGSEKRMEYTVIGDDVNAASRIEGASKVYGVMILITESTYLDVKDTPLVLREVDRVRVVGKTSPVRIYELIAESVNDLTDAQVLAIEQYRQGLQAYYHRRWVEALAHFRRVEKLLPNNPGPAATMTKRCSRLTASPAPRKWDGVWDLTSK